MSLTLEQTLASILQSLANFFGVTTQTIMENAPMWLAKYGWYVTVKDLGFNIFVGVFIGAIISSIIWFILYLIIEVDFKKWHLHILTFVPILSVIITVCVPIIICIIAPEYVGIEALFSLLQN